MDLQAIWWLDLNRLWWNIEDARCYAEGQRAAQLAVAQKAVERGLCEARSGRLLVGQYKAALAAVEAALEGE